MFYNHLFLCYGEKLKKALYYDKINIFGVIFLADSALQQPNEYVKMPARFKHLVCSRADSLRSYHYQATNFCSPTKNWPYPSHQDSKDRVGELTFIGLVFTINQQATNKVNTIIIFLSLKVPAKPC